MDILALLQLDPINLSIDHGLDLHGAIGLRVSDGIDLNRNRLLRSDGDGYRRAFIGGNNGLLLLAAAGEQQ
jgi:hypothetical protein